MSAKQSLSLRSIQKKFQKILDDVFGNEEFQELIENFDGPESEIFTDSSKLIDIRDDIENFKNSVLACLKILSLKKGKKKFISDLENQFLSSVSSEFYDSESHSADDTPRKRNRVSDDQQDINKSISTSQKSTLRMLLSALLKLEHAEIFQYPVDSKLYPEYYEIIEHPMDIQTVKSKLNAAEYTSITDILTDIRLIWSNCMLFNAEDSEIYEWAKDLSQSFEDLVEEIVGPEYKVSKKTKRARNSSPSQSESASLKPSANESIKRKSGKAKSKISIPALDEISSRLKNRIIQDFDSDVPISRKMSRRIISFVRKSEFAEPFLLPVSEEVAPGYSDEIDVPMDLSTLDSNIKNGVYDESVFKFIDDVLLISRNCIEYNTLDSDIADWSLELMQEFEKSMVQSIEEEISANDDGTSSVEKSPNSLESNKTEDNKSSTLISSSDALISLKPNSKTARKYDDQEFDDDMEKEVIPDVITDPQNVTTEEPFEGITETNTSSMNPPVESSVAVKSEDTEIIDSIDTDKNDACDNDFDESWSTTHSASKKRGRKPLSDYGISKIQKSSLGPIGKILWNFIADMLDDPRAAPFRYPVKLNEAPGYLDVVQIPMDFTTLKSRLDYYENNVERFFQDTMLIFHNCQKYNAEGSLLWQCAEDLRRIADERFHDVFAVDNHGNFAISGNNIPKKYRKSEVPFTPSTPVEKKPKSSQPVANISAAALLGFASRTVEDIDQIITMMKSDAGLRTVGVRDWAADKMKFVADSATVNNSFVVLPRVYEILSLGTISISPGFHDSTHIYPIGYKCQRELKLSLSSGSKLAHLDVVSSVLSSQGNGPRFVVMIDNGTVLSESDGPFDAWKRMTDEFLPLKVIKLLSARMARCVSVLHRLCISTDAHSFFDISCPRSSPEYSTFRSKIVAPICLREVHRKLMQGYYTDEFDFAFDMRLVFSQAFQYFTSDPVVCQKARRLSDLFDNLLCNWVHNIQDRSVDDLAYGPWDDWKHLRIFDDNFEWNRPPPRFVECKLCADHYPEHEVQNSSFDRSKWLCSRCKNALLNSSFPTLENIKSSPASRYNVAYTREEHGQCIYVPNPELGIGWYQALRLRRGGVKNVFLSPLGDVLTSRNIVVAYKKVESEIYDDLIKEREAHFSVDNDSPVLYRRCIPKINIKLSSKFKSMMVAKDEDDEQEPVDSFTFDIDRTRKDSIHFGELFSSSAELESKAVHFEILKPNLKELFRSRSIEDAISLSLSSMDASKFVSDILSVDDLPETGFFGLEIPDVRIRIECLEAASLCPQYRSFLSLYARDNLIQQLLQERGRCLKFEEYDEELNISVQNERWVWEKLRLSPVPPLIDESSVLSVDNHVTLPTDFVSLFPPSIVEPKLGEILLCIWDFIDSMMSITGEMVVDFPISLSEVFECLNTGNFSDTHIPSYGQVIYDEIASLFTGFALADVKNLHEFNANSWSSLTALFPLNVITWPTILSRILIVSSVMNASESETIARIQAHHDDDRLLLLEYFFLLNYHPAMQIITFLSRKKQSNQDSHIDRAVSLCDGLESIQRSVWSRADFSIDLFKQDILQLFKNAIVVDEETNDVITLCCLEVLGWIDHDGQSEIGKPEMLWKYIEKDNNKRFTLLPINFMNHLSDKEKYDLVFNDFKLLCEGVRILRVKDVELWSMKEKASILLLLLELCRNTSTYTSLSSDAKEKMDSAFRNIDSVPLEPSTWPVFGKVNMDSFVTPCLEPQSAVCHYSKISSSVISDAYLFDSESKSLWAKIPEKLDHPLSMEDFVQPVVSRTNETSLWTLVPILKKICAARETALFEKEKYEARVRDFIPCLDVPSHQHLNNLSWKAARTLNLRSSPLGYDRFGRQYWLLNAQENMSFLPLGSFNLRDMMSESNGRADPAVLVRCRNGLWGIHRGGRLMSLLDLFDEENPYEKLLKENLVIRLTYAKGKFVNTFFRSKTMFHDWIQKKYRLEKLLSEFDSLPQASSPTESCKQIELAYARMNEARIQLYYAALYREEEEKGKDGQIKKIKKMKDSNQDDAMDFHPVRGWFRVDPYSRIRELSCNTIASKLHADINYVLILRVVTRRSPYRQMWISHTSKKFEISKDRNVQDGDAESVRNDPALESTADMSIFLDAAKILPVSPVVYQPPLVLQNPVLANNFRALPNVIGSTVVASFKLIKLKLELFNILLILPEKALRWSGMEEEMGPVKTEGENSVVKSVAAEEVDIEGSNQESGLYSEEKEKARLAEEKLLRKKKRRERRRIATEKVFRDIQQASTPQELMNVVDVIEQAVPVSWFLDADRGRLPSSTSSKLTVSDLALRIFSLDRLIRYEEIPGIEQISSKLACRPRTNFVARCSLLPFCRNFMCHPGRCNQSSEDFSSRYPFIAEHVSGGGSPMTSMVMSSAPSTASPSSVLAASYYANHPSALSNLQQSGSSMKPSTMSGYKGVGTSGMTSMYPSSSLPGYGNSSLSAYSAMPNPGNFASSTMPSPGAGYNFSYYHANSASSSNGGYVNTSTGSNTNGWNTSGPMGAYSSQWSQSQGSVSYMNPSGNKRGRPAKNRDAEDEEDEDEFDEEEDEEELEDSFKVIARSEVSVEFAKTCGPPSQVISEVIMI